MYLLYKYSFLIILSLSFIHSTFLRHKQIDPLLKDAENDDELLALKDTKDLVEQLNIKPHTNFFSDKYYKTPNNIEITQNAANLMGNDEKSWKSFRKLNNVMNKVWKGDESIKNNPLIKPALNVILNDKSLKTKTRVGAAKLAARMTDLPVSIQITETDTNRSGKDFTSHIIVPRSSRIYRPDYYIENYKAGNWGLDAIY
jgi:hypothetical protein